MNGIDEQISLFCVRWLIDFPGFGEKEGRFVPLLCLFCNGDFQVLFDLQVNEST